MPASIVNSGYPGGCAVPQLQAAPTSSPLSPPATDVATVLPYTAAAYNVTATAHGQPRAMMTDITCRFGQAINKIGACRSADDAVQRSDVSSECTVNGGTMRSRRVAASWRAAVVATLAATILCLAAGADGATLTVVSGTPAPGEYGSVAAAFAAAAAGDVLELQPGVYSGVNNTGIAVTDAKPLRITGTGGWGAVVLDCLGANQGFSFTGSDANALGASEIVGVTIRNCSAPVGGVVYASGLSVHLRDVALLDSHATGLQFGVDGMGGAMYLKDTNSTITNALISRHYSAFGCIFAAGTDASVYTNVTFRRLEAAYFGGGFIPEGQSASILKDCVFENNYSPYGGAIDTGGTSTSTFIRTTFRYNTAGRGAGVYHYGESASTFIDCVFHDNFGSNSGGAIEAGTSVRPTFRNCTFDANHATGQGGGIRVSGEAKPTFESCTFRNHTAPRGGLSSHGGKSTAVFQGCVFENNEALLVGGVIECQSEALVSVHESLFRNNKAFRGGAIYQDGPTPWRITDTVFLSNTGTSGAALAVEGSAVVALDGCTFHNNTADRGGGAALVGLDSHVTFTNCTFSSNTCGSDGGAVSVEDSAYAVMRDVVFVDNVAMLHGGAIASTASINVSQSIFSANTAQEDGGGAVYIATTTTEACEVSTMSQNTFVGNSAAKSGGGAVFESWSMLFGFSYSPATSLCIVNCTDCHFAANTAAYGDTVATPAFQLVAIDGTMLAGDVLPLVASNVTIVAQDFYGNVVARQTGMRVVTRLADGASSSMCNLPAPPIAALTAGVGHFTSVAVGAAPDTACTVTFSAEPVEANLPKSVDVTVSMLACAVGYQAVGSGVNYHCSSCPAGTYNLNGDGDCRPCSSGLLCQGGSDVQVERDHWPFLDAATGRLTAYQCPPNFCCDQNDCPIAAPCTQHREGFMCGKCVGGFADVGGKCVPCDGTNYVFITLLIIGSVLFAMFNVALDRTERNPLLSQVTFFMQVALLIVPLSDMTSGMSSFAAVLDVDITGLLEAFHASAGSSSSECIAQWSGLGLTAAYFSVPFLLFTSLGLVFLVHYTVFTVLERRRRSRTLHSAHLAVRSVGAAVSSSQIKSPTDSLATGAATSSDDVAVAVGDRASLVKRRELSFATVLKQNVTSVLNQRQFPSRRYTAAAFRLVLLSYSVVSDTALQLMMCHTLTGNNVMVTQPSVTCWSSDHTLWGIVSIALFVVWVVGLPVGIVLFLWVVKQAGPLYSTWNRLQYGILYDDFREERYWFLAVNLTRRSAAVLVFTLLFNSGLLRHFALFLLCLAFLLTHVHMQPYYRLGDNVVATGLLLALTLLSATMIAKSALPSGAVQLDNEYGFLMVSQFAIAIGATCWLVMSFVLMVVRMRRHIAKDISATVRERKGWSTVSTVQRAQVFLLCLRAEINARAATDSPKLGSKPAAAKSKHLGSHSRSTPPRGTSGDTAARGRGSRPARGRGTRRHTSERRDKEVAQSNPLRGNGDQSSSARSDGVQLAEWR